MQIMPSKMHNDDVASKTLVIITSSFSSIVSECCLKSFSTFYHSFEMMVEIFERMHQNDLFNGWD